MNAPELIVPSSVAYSNFFHAIRYGALRVFAVAIVLAGLFVLLGYVLGSQSMWGYAIVVASISFLLGLILVIGAAAVVMNREHDVMIKALNLSVAAGEAKCAELETRALDECYFYDVEDVEKGGEHRPPGEIADYYLVVFNRNHKGGHIAVIYTHSGDGYKLKIANELWVNVSETNDQHRIRIWEFFLPGGKPGHRHARAVQDRGTFRLGDYTVVCRRYVAGALEELVLHKADKAKYFAELEPHIRDQSAVAAG